jgi:hypothetical protein
MCVCVCVYVQTGMFCQTEKARNLIIGLLPVPVVWSVDGVAPWCYYLCPWCGRWTARCLWAVSPPGVITCARGVVGGRPGVCGRCRPLVLLPELVVWSVDGPVSVDGVAPWCRSQSKLSLVL